MQALFSNLNTEIDFYKYLENKRQNNDFVSMSEASKFKQAKFFLNHVSLFHSLFIIEKGLETILAVSLMIIAPLCYRDDIFSNTSSWNLLFLPLTFGFIISLCLMFTDWRFPFNYSKHNVKQSLN